MTFETFAERVGKPGATQIEERIHNPLQLWINLTDAAAYLGISPRTLRLAIDRGEIPADHPFADGPWVIRTDSLNTKTAQNLKRLAHVRSRKPAVLFTEEHLNLFSST